MQKCPKTKKKPPVLRRECGAHCAKPGAGFPHPGGFQGGEKKLRKQRLQPATINVPEVA
jgi:hypothetical protein